MEIKQLFLSGTYYTYGKSLGTAAKQDIIKTLALFQRSSLYNKLQNFLLTPKGAEILAAFERGVQTYCENVVSELRGVADGAGVTYRELFLLNTEPEWDSLFSASEVAENKDNFESKSSVHVADGCTSIFLPISDTKQVYLGHTEDVDPKVKDLGYLIHAKIYKDEEETELIESFTEYVTAGIMPGSKFGFNRYGLMYGSDSILQLDINLSGIPRKFVFRTITAAKTIEDVKQKLATFPGIATAATFNFLYKENVDGDEKTVACVFEIAGDPLRGVVFKEFYPSSIYHHCNVLKLLPTPCSYRGSSVPREKILRQLVSEDRLSSYEDLIKAFSIHEGDFPIFRSGEPPDTFCTAAMVLFDSSKMMMTVYRDRPDTSPGVEFPVVRC